MVTIVYAFRNRDVLRVKASLDSLRQQTNTDFKVVFVDYGSELILSEDIQRLVEKYDFAKYFYVGHTGLLWNKSKAINFGIKNASTDFILISDIDIVYPSETIDFLQDFKQEDKFFLFKIGYLTKEGTRQYYETLDFKTCKVKHFGYTFGVGLFSKKALVTVGGLDDFFHFYGSEDEDLNQRLIASGYCQIKLDSLLVYHLWHVAYNSYDDSILSKIPRLYNIKRINQQHFTFHLKSMTKAHENNVLFGTVVEKEEYEQLLQPTRAFELPNIHAIVHHFIHVQLPLFENEIIKITIQEGIYYRSLKHRLKKLLKRQTQPYISIKQVNDLLLTEILYRYKHHNYAYEISDDLKTITFTIKL
jgi:glycosyltransferase involved in cell wall biosynthesis